MPYYHYQGCRDDMRVIWNSSDDVHELSKACEWRRIPGYVLQALHMLLCILLIRILDVDKILSFQHGLDVRNQFGNECPELLRHDINDELL